jgi:hypothetical protein
MTVQLPAHLSDMINNLGTAAHGLAEEVRADRAARDAEAAAEAAQRRRESRRLTMLLAIIGVLVLAVAGLSIYSRIAGNQSRSIIKTIESCTTADGECAKEGQRRTEDAIGKLLRMNIEVAACARNERTDAEYRACVDKALADLLTAPPAGTPTTPAPPASSARPSPTPAPAVG